MDLNYPLALGMALRMWDGEGFWRETTTTNKQFKGNKRIVQADPRRFWLSMLCRTKLSRNAFNFKTRRCTAHLKHDPKRPRNTLSPIQLSENLSPALSHKLSTRDFKHKSKGFHSPPRIYRHRHAKVLPWNGSSWMQKQVAYS